MDTNNKKYTESMKIKSSRPKIAVIIVVIIITAQRT